MSKEGPALLGPGAYCPAPTAGSTRPAELPKPRVVQHSHYCKPQPCPRCGKSRSRDRVFPRTLHDVGERIAGRPRASALPYAQYDWPANKIAKTREPPCTLRGQDSSR